MRPGRPVLMDGVRYESIVNAAAASGTSRDRIIKALRNPGAMVDGIRFERADIDAPRRIPDILLLEPRHPGPLMVEPCVHRLGAYLGGGW